MLTTSTVSGCGVDGRIHEVRIAWSLGFRRGTGGTRYIICGSCGHRRTARGLARSEAEHHLSEHRLTEHSAYGGARPRLSPAPWILGLIGVAGFLSVFAVTVLHH
ncbi:MAG TPA: hypothetical protein VFY14_20750 [Streptomyces sp.]|nr:hypothetical protein [Streptomyces sp.]